MACNGGGWPATVAAAFSPAAKAPRRSGRWKQSGWKSCTSLPLLPPPRDRSSSNCGSPTRKANYWPSACTCSAPRDAARWAGCWPIGTRTRMTRGPRQPPSRAPNGKTNLAYVGNGARPATASSTIHGYAAHQAKGLNDGLYGNDHSWIPAAPHAWFQIDLGGSARVGRFKLGRDRSGQYADRGVESLRIEASADGRRWQTLFRQNHLAGLPDYDPTETMENPHPRRQRGLSK